MGPASEFLFPFLFILPLLSFHSSSFCLFEPGLSLSLHLGTLCPAGNFVQLFTTWPKIDQHCTSLSEFGGKSHVHREGQKVNKSRANCMTFLTGHKGPRGPGLS